jgi:hypothetical protein
MKSTTYFQHGDIILVKDAFNIIRTIKLLDNDKHEWLTYSDRFMTFTDSQLHDMYIMHKKKEDKSRQCKNQVSIYLVEVGKNTVKIGMTRRSVVKRISELKTSLLKKPIELSSIKITHNVAHTYENKLLETFRLNFKSSDGGTEVFKVPDASTAKDTFYKVIKSF